MGVFVVFKIWSWINLYKSIFNLVENFFFFLKIFGMKIYFYRFEIIYREVLNIFDL